MAMKPIDWSKVEIKPPNYDPDVKVTMDIQDFWFEGDDLYIRVNGCVQVYTNAKIAKTSSKTESQPGVTVTPMEFVGRVVEEDEE
jgi:hypothetical protein